MWPFRKKLPVEFESWPIVRSSSGGPIPGRALSVFINNWQCHLTTVGVYADGAIDCWGFVDRSLFQQKLASRWVVPAPKPDQMISVFHFGHAHPTRSRWFQSSGSIRAAIETALRALNPGMTGLLDMHGSDTEIRDGVRHAKLGLAKMKVVRQDSKTSEAVLGDSVAILRRVGTGFELTRLFIYADGLARVGPDGDLVNLDQLPALHARGTIATQAPTGSVVTIRGLGEFTATEEFGRLDFLNLHGELEDKVRKLNGQPSVVTLCAQAFEVHEKSPTRETFAALRAAYERVPEHLRCYCGDMDTRDTAIRRVLYGDDSN